MSKGPFRVTKKPIFVSKKRAQKNHIAQETPQLSYLLFYLCPSNASSSFPAHWPEMSPVAIDQEWVASLVGLRMRVAAGFVPGRMGEEEYIAGKIARVDVDVDDVISASDIFMLELDDSSGTFHCMRYDAVLHYADEQQDIFHAFNLPSSPPCDPSHEEAVRFPLRYVQISTFILPPPQKEAAQTEAVWRSRR